LTFSALHVGILSLLALVVGFLVGRAWNGRQTILLKKRNLVVTQERDAAIRLMAARRAEQEVRLAS